MDVAQAAERYIALGAGNLAGVEANHAVAAFLSELTRQYPQMDDVPEDQIDDCPWSAAFDVSDGHIILPIAWSRCVEMAPVILALAEKHGLMVYDPQSDNVFLPPQLAR